jgi:hypothetical protein
MLDVEEEGIGLGVLDSKVVGAASTQTVSWVTLHRCEICFPSPQILQLMHTKSASLSGPQVPVANVTPSTQVLQALHTVLCIPSQALASYSLSAHTVQFMQVKSVLLFGVHVPTLYSSPPSHFRQG